MSISVSPSTINPTAPAKVMTSGSDSPGKASTQADRSDLQNWLNQLDDRLIAGELIDRVEALTIAKEIGDRSREGNALNNLGVTYIQLEQYGKAN